MYVLPILCSFRAHNIEQTKLKAFAEALSIITHVHDALDAQHLFLLRGSSTSHFLGNQADILAETETIEAPSIPDFIRSVEPGVTTSTRNGSNLSLDASMSSSSNRTLYVTRRTNLSKNKRLSSTSDSNSESSASLDGETNSIQQKVAKMYKALPDALKTEMHGAEHLHLRTDITWRLWDPVHKIKTFKSKASNSSFLRRC